uniref:Uncharacterized protein n=1 Tax=Glossina austeni TaxID=7395 RepID=A0A1A9V4Y7_GLOAU
MKEICMSRRRCIKSFKKMRFGYEIKLHQNIFVCIYLYIIDLNVPDAECSVHIFIDLYVVVFLSTNHLSPQQAPQQINRQPLFSTTATAISTIIKPTKPDEEPSKSLITDPDCDYCEILACEA